MKPCRALVASVPSIRASMTRRVVRSTSGPTADPLRAPLMRSPSQWPGTVRVAPRRDAQPSTSYGGSGRVDRSLAPEAGALCAPDAVPPAGRSSGRRVAAHTGPHRWSRPRGASACRQDTRVGAARQSARASSPRPDASARTATATGRGVYAAAVADGPEPTPGCAPYRPDRGGPAQRCGPPRGSRCWGLAPTPAPLSVTTGREPGPSSGSHGLCHSSACNIVLTWQHRSPSGLAVLHLE